MSHVPAGLGQLPHADVFNCVRSQAAVTSVCSHCAGREGLLVTMLMAGRPSELPYSPCVKTKKFEETHFITDTLQMEKKARM